VSFGHTPEPWLALSDQSVVVGQGKKRRTLFVAETASEADALVAAHAPALLLTLKSLLITCRTGHWRDTAGLSITSHPSVARAQEVAEAAEGGIGDLFAEEDGE
jgi:hypothetical protein